MTGVWKYRGKSRAVLNRYYRGLSIAEITEETGQNDKTVYGHLRRALQR
ncbi:sigma-70 family RNA polymerase sigma factor, partial [Escherichia coli]